MKMTETMQARYAHEVVPKPDADGTAEEWCLYHAARSRGFWLAADPSQPEEAGRRQDDVLMLAIAEYEMAMLYRALHKGLGAREVAWQMVVVAETMPEVVEITPVKLLEAAGIDAAEIKAYRSNS